MSEPVDWRNLRVGLEIPSQNYSDQPYIVKTSDGAWLCAMTTGLGYEGEAGQHVVTMRSADRGRTWSEPVPVEPPDGREASYAVMLAVPAPYPNAGRVYIFYNHNTDNVREAIADPDVYPGGICRRVDSLGHFVFKVSDDNGRRWSLQRYDIPVRTLDIDRQNPYGGTLKFFWNVAKPFIHDGAVYCTLHKVGGFGKGFFVRSEGVLLRSDNLLTAPDPAKARWITLPDGDVGLRAPPGGGPIAEEHSCVSLSDGTLFCVYRTIDGHPCHAYSHDDGHTWNIDDARYAPGKRRIKNPRAANFVWKCENGRYLYWFHNNGTTWYNNGPTAGNRNVAWLSAGREVDGRLHWSEPEIVLYSDAPLRGPSYPDFIEDGGHSFISATQKTEARVVEVDPTLLNALWAQHEASTVTRAGLVLEWGQQALGARPTIPAPELPPLSGSRGRDRALSLYERGGFSLDLWVRFDTLTAGQILLDGRDTTGKGIVLATTDQRALRLDLCDGWAAAFWSCDPGVLEPNRLQHLVAIVDGGPKVISFVVDGVLCDGGMHRPFGWGRFRPALKDLNGATEWRFAQGLRGEIRHLRVYNRYLLTSEAVGNYHAGPPP